MSESFGKYRVLERIGEGGFGQVYRGRDPQLARDVAIKTVSMAAPEARERFPREAAIAAGLRHPAIVTIYDFGEQDGVPYLVQEYLPGEDLSRRIARRDAGSLADRVRWLRQVADGLHYAHGRGVVHRDVKPGNVRILEDGSVRIMDFGIAKVLDATTQLTGTNVSLGTSGYVAPEQLEGKPIDHRADMFAFGVMAYELVTYERPFVGDTVSATLYRILTEDPTPVTVVEPGCPPRLAGCIERCLRKRREERFADMHEVGTELEAVLADLDTHTAESTPPGAPTAATLPLTTGGSSTSATRAPVTTEPDDTSRSNDTAQSGDTSRSGDTALSGDAAGAGTGRQKAALAVAALLLIGLTGWGVAALVGAVRGGSGATSDAAGQTAADTAGGSALAGGVVDSVEQATGDTGAAASTDTATDVSPATADASADPEGGPQDPPTTRTGPGGTGTGGSGGGRTGADPGTRTGGAASQAADSATPANAPAAQIDPSRVLVLVSGERAAAVNAAQTTVLGELQRAGRPVVDPDAIDAIRADAAAVQALAAGASPAAGIGRAYGAGVVVVADLASDAAPAPGGFVSGSAVLTARFYDTRTGALLLAETFRVGAGGAAARPGATEVAAITQAAESVARQLGRAILTRTGR